MEFKEKLEKDLKKITGLKEIRLEKPKKEFGDYAFPCFELAKKLKRNPNEIAKEIAEKLKGYRLKVIGPYINFFIKESEIYSIVNKILKEKDKFGKQKNKAKRIVVEYVGPNTNKPLHLGHLRNMVLGYSLVKILKFNGNKVFSVNINNDRGIHICKAMVAYKKYGKINNEWDTPEKSGMKPDFFVGKYYVLFNKKVKENPELEEEAKEMLRKWENNDKEVIALWKKMNKWALEGFRETYKTFGIKFDKEYFESETYKKGKEIVLKAFKKGIFKKDEKGNIVAVTSGGKNKVLLRSDGTSVYITQDIALAKEKYEDFRYDLSIYVVATEQNYHFKVLFEVLKMLGFSFADKCYHFAYGMVNLPSGKMKSREGEVVDVDNLVKEMVEMAKKETKKRHKEISEKELEERAKKIALAAIRFYLLKYEAIKDILFDKKKSISFEGETGPYLLYSYARINSIIKKHKGKVKKVKLSLLNKKEEIEIIKKLNEFEDLVKEIGKNYKIHLLCRYLLDLAQLFNEFYHKYPVLKAEQGLREARLMLIKAIKQVLKNGLGLLGIDVLEEM